MMAKKGSWRVNYEDFYSDFNVDDALSDYMCSLSIAPSEENAFNGTKLKFRTRPMAQDKIVATTSSCIQPKGVGNELNIQFI